MSSKKKNGWNSCFYYSPLKKYRRNIYYILMIKYPKKISNEYIYIPITINDDERTNNQTEDLNHRFSKLVNHSHLDFNRESLSWDWCWSIQSCLMRNRSTSNETKKNIRRYSKKKLKSLNVDYDEGQNMSIIQFLKAVFNT